MRRSFFSLAAAACSVVFLHAAPALAQMPSEEGFDAEPEDTLEGVEQAEKEKEFDEQSEQAEKRREAGPEEPSDPNRFDPYEDPNKTYRFIGLRWRNLIVPQFMINIFADGGATVNVFTFGPEFTTRKDNVEWDLALSYADYSMDEFMFKGKSDDIESYEIISSDMKVLYFTVDLMKEFPIDKKGRFSFLIGGGVGIGAVFGNLYRNQAYPRGNPSGLVDSVSNEEERRSWDKCAGPATAGGQTVASAVSGDPAAGGVVTFYCDDENDHYGGYDEPSWFNGGSKPSVWPWLSLPQVSFRFKPIKQLQTRFDAGFSLFSGFFLGMSAGYGFPAAD